MKTEPIPQWVIDYNNVGYKSGAGKAIKILMEKVSDHEFESVELKSENKELREQLANERELRKELVQWMEYLYDYAPHPMIKIESLIQKAKDAGVI